MATVLDEVVESARALTGARSGVITTLDERGEIQDFVTAGPSPRDAKTLQGTPMHHRGEHLGHFFLADKDNDEAFTAEDEEILVLFASLAATAIANARTHLDVERARADLEALIESSPVGVVVFDARTGRAVSLNCEARRIVEEIRTPGQSVDQLLEVMTWRDIDGREVSLEELPLAGQLEDARTMRAEEIELSVPDGRSVRTLVNATPVRSREGEVESVVVTAQDLRPLEELDRQRAEFLGMVSHELRAPLTSIKGSTASVLGAAPIPPQAEMLQFFRIIDRQADHMRGLIANLLDAGSIEAGTLTVAPAACDVAELVDRSRNTFLRGGGRNPVLIDLPPDLPWVMADGERIVQVLNNLLANAARHSSPSSPIRVEGAREGAYVALTVSDQGRGIPPDRLRHLFRKRSGLAGGTGLGLMICKGLVEAHGGRIGAESGGPCPGTRVTFTIPVAESAPRDVTPPSLPPPAHREEKPRILVLDDDPETLRHVRNALSDARYAPIVTGDPDDLSGLIRAEKPHLVLLDLMLPGTNGIELMQQVPELSDLPVIFISGYGRDETIARALGSGAVDYIVKPFSSTELVARVQVALRGRTEPDTFAVRELTVAYSRRQVTLAGRRLPLTPTQFELLRVLTRDAGQVLTTRTLLRRVWGKQASRHNDRIRTIVKQLRAKLGDDADDPAYIFTAHGVGYRFASPDEA